MAKNSILDWDATAANNTDIAGIGIQGTNAVSNFDNALRTMMSQIKTGVDYKLVLSSKSGNYTAVLNDNNAAIRFSAAATLSLSAAATLGANWHCLVMADGGAVVIDPNASETINGAATITIPDGLSTIVICDGTNFRALEDYSMFSTKLDVVQPSADIASATTTDIGSVSSQNVRITGTTTITSFGTAASGTLRRVLFAGALTLTHNATSLILPGGANITTIAGDVAVFTSEGSGNWRCTSYSSALIQSGSNANGSWIRFPNGTQICQQTLTTGALNVAAGAIFSTNDVTWTFPISFVSGQALSAYGSDSVATTVWVNCGAYSSTSILVKAFCFTSAVARTVTVTAVGRWF